MNSEYFAYIKLRFPKWILIKCAKKLLKISAILYVEEIRIFFNLEVQESEFLFLLQARKQGENIERNYSMNRNKWH